jgi:WD40 repeat protein
VTSRLRRPACTAIDNTVRIWETTTGRCIRTIENPHAALGYACATADGRHALIQGAGGAVQVQKLDKGASAPQCQRM